VLPYSIFLVGVAFLLAFVLGTTIGMIAAWKRGGAVDSVAVPTLMALGAFPAFFTALLGVYFLGIKLQWFPIQHAYDSGLLPGFNWAFLSSAFRHAQLPILVIIAAFTGGWVLNMRTVMINTISEDYVAMAHAKGLRDRRVMTRYAGRNAILPPLNGFAAQFAGAVGGLVFVEYVFSYPGAGLTLQQAALGNDYPLTQGLLLVFASSTRACARADVAASARHRARGRPAPRLHAAPSGSPARPRVALAAALEPKVAVRLRARQLHGRHRPDRAVDHLRRPDRLQPACHPSGALLASPVRHDRPGQ
jgi:hypothetical protein